MELEYDSSIRITQRLAVKAAWAAWMDRVAPDKGTIRPRCPGHDGGLARLLMKSTGSACHGPTAGRRHLRFPPRSHWLYRRAGD